MERQPLPGPVMFNNYGLAIKVRPGTHFFNIIRTGKSYNTSLRSYNGCPLGILNIYAKVPEILPPAISPIRVIVATPTVKVLGKRAREPEMIFHGSVIRKIGRKLNCTWKGGRGRHRGICWNNYIGEGNRLGYLQRSCYRLVNCPFNHRYCFG